MTRARPNAVLATGPRANGAGVPRVVVIIVMYRAAEQVIECISSVLASLHRDFRIVVLDNASPDGAYERVLQWARGQAGALPLAASPLTWECTLSGPIDHQELCGDIAPASIAGLAPLTLVQTGANLGYAGGNNVALKWLQACADWDYAWILNPDTVVDPNAMPALVARCRSDANLGPVGARVCFYDAPQTIQLRGGGVHKRWSGRGRMRGRGRAAGEAVDTGAIERSIDYVSGACLFFSRALLGRAGLMDERYFLYFEEIDWCRRRGDMRLGYCHDAIVYHRLGGSIGSSISHRSVSPLSLRWMYRNRLVFTRKFFPLALPSVYLCTYLDMARMIQKGAARNAWLVFKVVNGLVRISKP
jgi:GT2 family glycosyltransferase